ncbi:hypothetical protein HUJ05_007778 [Dendroctonus ponderosae]|nr:hypothetical protein HUJ05_007778 [Dendroctonus ponderosae]
MAGTATTLDRRVITCDHSYTVGSRSRWSVFNATAKITVFQTLPDIGCGGSRWDTLYRATIEEILHSAKGVIHALFFLFILLPYFIIEAIFSSNPQRKSVEGQLVLLDPNCVAGTL